MFFRDKIYKMPSFTYFYKKTEDKIGGQVGGGGGGGGGGGAVCDRLHPDSYIW